MIFYRVCFIGHVSLQLSFLFSFLLPESLMGVPYHEEEEQLKVDSLARNLIDGRHRSLRWMAGFGEHQLSRGYLGFPESKQDLIQFRWIRLTAGAGDLQLVGRCSFPEKTSALRQYRQVGSLRQVDSPAGTLCRRHRSLRWMAGLGEHQLSRGYLGFPESKQDLTQFHWIRLTEGAGDLQLVGR